MNMLSGLRPDRSCVQLLRACLQCVAAAAGACLQLRACLQLLRAAACVRAVPAVRACSAVRAGLAPPRPAGYSCTYTARWYVS